jgi:Rad3-related DNA helicase
VELGQIIMNLVNIVPDGMVAFFPSYSFLAEVRSVWEASGLLAKLGLKKKVLSRISRNRVTSLSAARSFLNRTKRPMWKTCYATLLPLFRIRR